MIGRTDAAQADAMARIYSMLLIGAAMLFPFCTQTHAQGLRYSLSPLAPFPCSAVSFDGNSIVFRRTLVIVCNGKNNWKCRPEAFSELMLCAAGQL